MRPSSGHSGAAAGWPHPRAHVRPRGYSYTTSFGACLWILTSLVSTCPGTSYARKAATAALQEAEAEAVPVAGAGATTKQKQRSEAVRLLSQAGQEQEATSFGAAEVAYDGETDVSAEDETLALLEQKALTSAPTSTAGFPQMNDTDTGEGGAASGTFLQAANLGKVFLWNAPSAVRNDPLPLSNGYRMYAITLDGKYDGVNRLVWTTGMHDYLPILEFQRNPSNEAELAGIVSKPPDPRSPHETQKPFIDMDMKKMQTLHGVPSYDTLLSWSGKLPVALADTDRRDIVASFMLNKWTFWARSSSTPLPVQLTNLGYSLLGAGTTSPGFLYGISSRDTIAVIKHNQDRTCMLAISATNDMKDLFENAGVYNPLAPVKRLTCGGSTIGAEEAWVDEFFAIKKSLASVTSAIEQGCSTLHVTGWSRGGPLASLIAWCAQKSGALVR